MARTGRPKLDIRQDVQIVVRMTQDEMTALENMCARSGLRKSELVRRILREYMDEHKTN